MSGDLKESVFTLPRVGTATAAALKRLNIFTVGDVVNHIPFRYEDLSVITPVARLQEGVATSVRVRVAQIRGRRGRKRKMHITEALLTDASGSVRAVWFQQPYLLKTLTEGSEWIFSGTPRREKFGLQLTAPVYERAPDAVAGGETVHTARIVPQYGLTEGVSSKQFRTLVVAALKKITANDDWIPAKILARAKIISFALARCMIHFPRTLGEVIEAQKRFQFEAALDQEISERLLKKFLTSESAVSLVLDAERLRVFISSLPFKLTDDQRRAAFAIMKDTAAAHPMNRLVQGDVGSGKTVVAALAMYHAALNGYASAFLAPTQILAEQHFITLEKLLAPAGVPVILVSASTRSKRVTLPSTPHVVVGTHALLYDKRDYPNTALVVVDEQHRFGVAQRQLLKAKVGVVAGGERRAPHFVAMTATPIPRSLALTVFGALAVSSIQQMPAGRKKIITRLASLNKRRAAEDFVRQRLIAGEQMFVVSPIIDPSDILGVESAIEVYERLSETFKEFRVALVHGKMKSAERTAVMEKFRAQEIDILVATTVIEVGVDVPNATIMWIEGAERFGLAQLHQLRGRVGRAEKQSYCILFTSAGQRDHSAAGVRLRFFAEISDGFLLAEKDLELRGSGEIFGTLQSGFGDLEFLKTIPENVWSAARGAAEIIMRDSSLFKFFQERTNVREGGALE